MITRISGPRLDRPGLDELRQDLRTSLFDVIYFLDADRIAREVTIQTLIIEEILKHRKELVINGKDYGFVGLVARGGEGGDLAAPGSRKFDCTWPSPPMPTTPTRSVGLTSNCCNGPNTVTPLQSSGPDPSPSARREG